MLHRLRSYLLAKFLAKRTAEMDIRVERLEHELRGARSTIAVLELERDLLTAALERERQRLAADIKNEVARGVRATGVSSESSR